MSFGGQFSRLFLLGIYTLVAEDVLGNQNVALATANVFGVRILRWLQRMYSELEHCAGYSKCNRKQNIALVTANVFGIRSLRWLQRMICERRQDTGVYLELIYFFTAFMHTFTALPHSCIHLPRSRIHAYIYSAPAFMHTFIALQPSCIWFLGLWVSVL